MKTALQKHLVTIAPSISIRTHWMHDHSAGREVFKAGNVLAGEKPSKWRPWYAEVEVRVIIEGDLISANDYMSEIWERRHADPALCNPDISGYELQMTASALNRIHDRLLCATPQTKEVTDAIAYCENAMREQWEAQQSKSLNAETAETAV